MPYKLTLFALLTLFFALVSIAVLPAQHVKDGYTVKEIYLSKKAAAYAVKMPVLNELAVVKNGTLYPRKGYKLVALRKGTALGILPDFYQPEKYSTERGTLLKGKLKSFGLCLCADGDGACRMPTTPTGYDRQGRPEYECSGKCACKQGLVIPDIRNLLDPARVENPEGTNEWPYGSGIGG